MCDSQMSKTFAASGMTSLTGKSYTFDSLADGYARGEACCGAVLQLDPGATGVHCVAGAVRQDGRSASLTAPNGTAQQALLRAALGWACHTASGAFLLEAHGTGTSLGDPIEARAMVAVRYEPEVMAAMGCKANFGHTEPAAGLSGVLKLSKAMQRAAAAPNAQLRAMNSHVRTAMREGQPSSLPVQLGPLPDDAEMLVGGVSSFGLNGTIAHTVLAFGSGGGSEALAFTTAVVPTDAPQFGSRGAEAAGGGVSAKCSGTDAERSTLERRLPPLYRRGTFLWRAASHPFAQHSLNSSNGSIVFRSPAAGPLHLLVADHVVQGRVIFPGAGYLEMVRASAATGLSGVFFLQLLAVETPGLLIECAICDGRFEVGSSEADAVETVRSVHCSGATAVGNAWQRIDPASQRAPSLAADVEALYDGFDACGLQYGPGYRTLVQTWGGASNALARLRARLRHEGTQVHPADLDDALCTCGVIMSSGGGDATRLPFALDDALLQAALGELWAVRALHSPIHNPAPVACLLTTFACA